MGAYPPTHSPTHLPTSTHRATYPKTRLQQDPEDPWENPPGDLEVRVFFEGVNPEKRIRRLCGGFSALPGVVYLVGGGGGCEEVDGGDGDMGGAVVAAACCGAAAGERARLGREAEWMEGEARAAEAAAFVRCPQSPCALSFSRLLRLPASDERCKLRVTVLTA